MDRLEDQGALTMRVLTNQERMDAYAAVAERFSLRHGQRTLLDNSPAYLEILTRALAGQWVFVEALLRDEEII